MIKFFLYTNKLLNILEYFRKDVKYIEKFIILFYNIFEFEGGMFMNYDIYGQYSFKYFLYRNNIFATNFVVRTIRSKIKLLFKFRFLLYLKRGLII